MLSNLHNIQEALISENYRNLFHNLYVSILIKNNQRGGEMQSKIKTSILLCLVLFGVIPITNPLNTKASPEQTIVYVEPDLIQDLLPPAQFTIYVKVANVSNFYGIDLQFTWDPTIIKYVSHQKHIPVEDYPDGVLHEPTISVRNDVDENASMPGSEPGTRYWLAESSMLPAEPFNGSGVIFEMTFEVVGLGSSPLHIVACTLADISGNPIPATLLDGLFVNYIPPPPPPANIFVSPVAIVDSTLDPCEYFQIDINVEEVQNLYAFDLWLGFNGSLLEVSNVLINPAFPPPVVIYDPGQLEVSASLEPPDPPITGNLTLVTIEFHILDKGESILDLHNVTLLNDQGEPIEINEPGDGYFNNMLITKMFVDPAQLIAPNLKPGDDFDIDIKIENAVEMYDYEFKLSYDTNVITCLGGIVIPPNNETHFTVNIEINDTAGVIWVYVQYYPPAEPFSIYNATTVFRITFQVQEYGQTPLHLYETRISDKFGNSKSHETEDGFFATLLRDVSIELVNVTSANMVYPGRIVTIEVVAMNRGNMTTETFNVTFYYDSNIMYQQEVTLDPWSNITITFEWNTTGLTPCNNFTIWAEASPVPYETNLFNNVYYDGWVKIKMIGDVNGDGIIDILDIVEISLAYGSQEGDPSYNPEADLAAPWGYIDILDLVTCSSRYGWHC